GLINPPLASTAVGVVEPARAGMASGINSTFRQVGIATGIAGLGAVFSHTVRTKVVSLLSLTAGIDTNHIHALATSVAQGTGAGSAIAAAPALVRPAAILAVRTGFVDGLNELFLIGALVSFTAAALALVLIRNKDFEASAAHGPTAPPAAVPVGADSTAEDPGVPPELEPTAEDPDVSAESEPPAADPDVSAEPEPPAEDPEVSAEPEPPAADPEVSAEPEPTAAPEALPARVPAPSLDPVASALAPDPTASTWPAPDPPGPAAASPESILAAVEQAAADTAAYVERAIGRQLEADRGRVETASRGGDEGVAARAGRAGALRGRLQDLDEQRRRLAQALVVHTDAVEAHTQATLGHAQAAARHVERAAETRGELYRLIAGLGALSAEADAIEASAGGEPSPNGSPTGPAQAAEAEGARPGG
ncbi:MAG: hypothetical protein QOE27_340, partial [Solirubrobacteraceae bacterium]|nr:hypothetical protein [Solirubrobacteraceae bacterium]